MLAGCDFPRPEKPASLPSEPGSLAADSPLQALPLPGTTPVSLTAMEESAGPERVMIHLKLPGATAASGGSSRFDQLAQECGRALQASGTGQLDGTETTMGFAIVHCLGADADAMVREIEPILRSARPPAGSYIVKQHNNGERPDEQFSL